MGTCDTRGGRAQDMKHPTAFVQILENLKIFFPGLRATSSCQASCANSTPSCLCVAEGHVQHGAEDAQVCLHGFEHVLQVQNHLLEVDELGLGAEGLVGSSRNEESLKVLYHMPGKPRTPEILQENIQRPSATHVHTHSPPSRTFVGRAASHLFY